MQNIDLEILRTGGIGAEGMECKKEEYVGFVDFSEEKGKRGREGKGEEERGKEGKKEVAEEREEGLKKKDEETEKNDGRVRTERRGKENRRRDWIAPSQ